MEIIVGDVHGSIEQFLYPFYSNGFYDSVKKFNNELIFEHLDLHNNRIIFTGDIFYKGNDDVIIANTLSKLLLERNDIEWLLGNRDLLVFAKCFIQDLKLNESSYSFKESPFCASEYASESSSKQFLREDSKEDFKNDFRNGSESRFEKLNKNNIRRLVTEKRIKVITRLKNNILVSHAAITQEGINELKQVIDLKDISSVFNDDVLIELENESIDNYKYNTESSLESSIRNNNKSNSNTNSESNSKANSKNDSEINSLNNFKNSFKNNSIEFNSLEDLNNIFTDVNNIILYCTKLKIFYNKHIFEAIEESVIGHETFINEYPKEALSKIQKYNEWLTDEYISMNVQCKEDRMTQFLLSNVHYNDIEIFTNIHHTDCNCYKYKNPCCFCLSEVNKNEFKWIFLGNDKKFDFEMIEYEGRKYKCINSE